METKKIYDEFLELISENFIGLPDKPEENPKNTLEVLWHFSCGFQRTIKSISRFPLPELTESSCKQLKELIKRRISGIPLSHLIGIKEFMKIDFLVDSSALIPRKETEILGYAALSKIRECAVNQDIVKVIDACTGMGNLALAFAYHEPKSMVYAADIAEDAILLAQKNARNLSLDHKVTFFTGDLLAPFQSSEFSNSIDVLTCNPPYISTRNLAKMPEEIIKYEPEQAFNGGPYGLNIIFRLIKDSVELIKKEGWLCFEVGLGQGEGIMKIMERNKQFQKIEFDTDENGNVRSILAQVKK